MKKNKLWGVASILAAGALFFGVTGCDTGNDEYVEENPTTVKSYGASVYDGAVWDFSGFKGSGDSWTGNDTISNAEQAITGEIAASTEGSDGTKLVATNLKGKAGAYASTSTGYLQASKATATLANVSKGYSLTLTLGTTSDIYLCGTGAGSAAGQRYIAIADANDTLLVYKDNLGSGTNYDFQVQAAPAGEYKIYINGSGIVKLDLSSAHTYAAPASVAKVEFDATGFETSDDYKTAQNPNGYYISKKLFETFTPTLNGVDAAGESEDVTSSAKWYVISGDDKVVKFDSSTAGMITATYAGTAVVRGRVGMYMADYVVVATGSADFAFNSVEESAKTFEAATGSLTLVAKTKDNSIDVTKVVTWKSSDTEVATVSEGKITGLKAGTATITATLSDGAGKEFSDSINVTITACNKIIVTLLDTENDDFPEQGTVLNLSQQSTVDELVSATTTVINGDSKNVTKDCFSLGVPVINSTWVVNKIYSNVDQTDYPGIVYEPTAAVQSTKLASDSQLCAITITVTPPDGKTLSLTQISGAFRTNNAKHIVSVKSDDTELGAETSSTKDSRTFNATLTNALSISKATPITFYVTVKENKAEKKLSFANLKLYFSAE